MKKIWKGLAAAMMTVACAGMLTGCGSDDKVGVVDMGRVQKEAPVVQQYKEKTEAKQKEVMKELQDAKSTMSDEDFAKKQQQADQELNIFGASMQRQLLTDVQTKAGEVAKDKKIGIVMMKDAAPNGGIDITDEVIAKLQ